jgi:microsomal dipeptidase-like Zn-dependent dipeptidase
MTDKIESDENFQTPFEQTLQMLKLFESKVHEAKAKGFDVTIARSKEEFEKGLADGKTTILHSIEGAHSLGRLKNSENISEKDFYRNLDGFYDLGVCMITLAHFFENDVAPPVNGIPPSLRKLLICEDRDLNKSLTPMGEKIVKRMLERGMIIDLTHMTPIARKQVFNLNDERGLDKRPIVFSHVGVANMFRNSKHQIDSAMNPTDEEIMRIKECNGLIGVVFIKYWLVGKEEKDFWIFDLFSDPGFKYIYKTIKYIHRVTGTYDNIALGSDFDGFTDPLDDLKGSSKFPELINYLSNKGISDVNLEKITSGNILRVLKEGWGK